MKQRITISIDTSLLKYVDRLVRGQDASRSSVIESLIEDSQRLGEEEDRRMTAQAFFAEINAQEDEEREDWLRISMETQQRDG